MRVRGPFRPKMGDGRRLNPTRRSAGASDLVRNSQSSMSKKLFVGSLSFDTDDGSLRRAFEEFGEVTDAKVISDRDTGRSRGFGFVTFADASSADAAIDQMNGATLDGRVVNVNEAKERAPRRDDRRGGGRW